MHTFYMQISFHYLLFILYVLGKNQVIVVVTGIHSPPLCI